MKHNARNEKLFVIIDEMILQHRWMPDCLFNYEYNADDLTLNELKNKVIEECNAYFPLNESDLLSRLHEL